MVSRKQGIYGFISAAAIVSGILAGCGGSNSVSGLGGTVSTTGGITTAPGSGPATGVASSPAPQQVQVTTANGPITGTLPAGESIPANGAVATIPPGVPIIVGLSLSTSFHGRQTTPTPAATGAKPTTGSQGQVYVDGQNTGLTVTSGGALSGYLILTPGVHTVIAFGPFTIIGGSAFAPTELTVGQFNFRVPVLGDGTPAVPSALTLNLPVNGGTWVHGPFVTAGYPAGFAGSGGELIIVVDSARTISDGKTLVVNPTTGFATATYNGFGNTYPGHSNIPSTGVASVTFNVGG
jgi:hypothetical protein